MSRDTLGGDDPFSGEPMGEATVPFPIGAARTPQRHSCRLVQTAENLQAACSLFCVGSPSASPIYLLVLEAPPLGGSGHPVAFPVVGHDAFERASELFDGFAARYIKGGRP